jgi:hypothetical protein
VRPACSDAPFPRATCYDRPWSYPWPRGPYGEGAESPYRLGHRNGHRKNDLPLSQINVAALQISRRLTHPEIEVIHDADAVVSEAPIEVLLVELVEPRRVPLGLAGLLGTMEFIERKGPTLTLTVRRMGDGRARRRYRRWCASWRHVRWLVAVLRRVAEGVGDAVCASGGVIDQLGAILRAACPSPILTYPL